jgi:hypothetical protein
MRPILTRPSCGWNTCTRRRPTGVVERLWPPHPLHRYGQARRHSR